MNLIKLKFLRDGQPAGREYTYISKSAVEVGDTVQVREAEEGKDAPKGIVTAVNVPESEVESFRDKLKEIVGKVLERKIYSKWAFTADERQKAKINREIYEELKEKWRIHSGLEEYNPKNHQMEPINMDDYDLVYVRKAGYNHGEYTIHKNATDLSGDELALIFDGGNLCFGYTRDSENFFYIFED